VDTGAVLTPVLTGIALDHALSSDVDILQRTLLSRSNLEKLIAQTDLSRRAQTAADREVLLQSLATAIRIDPQTRNLFSIAYTDRSPKLARDVVQTIVNLFIESATGTSQDMQSARLFLERQIAAYQTQLRAAEQARLDFQTKYAEILPPSAGNASRLDTAREQAVRLNGQVIDATNRRDLLKQEIAVTPPLLTVDPGTRGASSGGVRASPPHSVPNPVYEQLKIRLIDAQSTLSSLTRQAGEAEAEATRLSAIARENPGIAVEYLNLTRDYEVLRKNYEELLARRESMRLGLAADEEVDKVKLRIVDAPQIPSIPAGPRRLLLNFAVLVAGLGAGFGVVFVLLQFDRTFYSVVDLRGVGFPVLGGISLQPRQRPMVGYAGRLSFVASYVLLLLAFGGVATYPLWLSRSL